MNKCESEMSFTDFDSRNPHIINHMILPLFRGMLSTGGIYALYDRWGKLLMLSDAQAKMFATDDGNKCTGYNLGNLPLVLLEKISTKIGLSVHNVWLDFNQMFLLHQLAVEKKELVQYIDLSPYYGNLYSHLVTVVPLFHPNGEIVAYQTQTRRCGIGILINLFRNCLGIIDNAVKSSGDKLAELQEELGVELSERQHEILFLLCNGLNQYEIADLLGIKRTTVAKILHTQINGKLDIDPPNTTKLIEKAAALGINELIPLRLRKQKFILFEKNNISEVNEALMH